MTSSEKERKNKAAGEGRETEQTRPSVISARGSDEFTAFLARFLSAQMVEGTRVSHKKTFFASYLMNRWRNPPRPYCHASPPMSLSPLFLPLFPLRPITWLPALQRHCMLSWEQRRESKRRDGNSSLSLSLVNPHSSGACGIECPRVRRRRDISFCGNLEEVRVGRGDPHNPFPLFIVRGDKAIGLKGGNGGGEGRASTPPPCRSPEISEFAFLVSSPCLPLPCLSLRLYMSLSQRSRRAREGKKTQYIPHSDHSLEGGEEGRPSPRSHPT